MKIQNTGNEIAPISAVPNPKVNGGGFERLLSEPPSPAEPAPSDKKAGTADFARRLTYPEKKPYNVGGLKDLLRDAMQHNGADIFREIELVCSDETGENIDMAYLSELLSLYEEAEGTRVGL